jgi:hypothetical protein
MQVEETIGGERGVAREHGQGGTFDSFDQSRLMARVRSMIGSRLNKRCVEREREGGCK